jgi:outer membrane immunogenic protein
MAGESRSERRRQGRSGGVAFGGFSSNLFLNGLNAASVDFPIANRFFSNMRVGWTAGGGIQYAVTDNWWVFGEYRYTNFGSLPLVLKALDTLFNKYDYDTRRVSPS